METQTKTPRTIADLEREIQLVKEGKLKSMSGLADTYEQDLLRIKIAKENYEFMLHRHQMWIDDMVRYGELTK